MSPRPTRPAHMSRVVLPAWPRISRETVVTGLLVLNLAGLAAVSLHAWRGGKPVVVVVGITQLAREYMAKLATSQVSPQEAKVRTELFLAVAQEAVRTAADRKGLLVVPRECVLAGEYGDITEEVSEAVNATLTNRPRSAAPSQTPAVIP